MVPVFTNYTSHFYFKKKFSFFVYIAKWNCCVASDNSNLRPDFCQAMWMAWWDAHWARRPSVLDKNLALSFELLFEVQYSKSMLHFISNSMSIFFQVTTETFQDSRDTGFWELTKVAFSTCKFPMQPLKMTRDTSAKWDHPAIRGQFEPGRS